MWTRGKDEQIPGKFAFRLYDSENRIITRQGGFDTAQAADRAAEIAQRKALFPEMHQTDLPDMSDDELDELLAELLTD